MTLDEFFAELATLPEKGFVPLVIAYEDSVIRLRRDNYEMCPITAVYCNRANNYRLWNPDDADAVVAILGIETGTAHIILDAADDIGTDVPKGRKLIMRQRLLRTLGLESEK